MKDLRTLACVLTLSTLTLLFYGAFAPGGAAIASPGITITQPNAGALVQGNVTVSVAYRSASGIKVTDLELFVDKARQAAVKLTAPATEGTYSFVWNTAGLEAGAHTVTAVAYDAKGRPGDVAVTVYVQQQGGRDTQAPTVSLSTPGNNGVVQGVVSLVANVLDNVGVKWVLFQLDNRFLFATNHSPFRYNWDTSKVANGEHSVQVYTYDASDNETKSQPVIVTVDNPSGRTLAGERPYSTATAQAPASTTTAPAPQTPVIAPQTSAPAVQAPATTTEAAALRPAPVASPVAAAQRDTRPAAQPPSAFNPTFEMSRRDIPTLPAVPSSTARETVRRSVTPPIVARPQTASATAYPDIDVQISRAGVMPGVAAPRVSATPRATSRPTASVPAQQPSAVATSSAVAALRSIDFAAADRRASTVPGTVSSRPSASAARPILGGPEVDAASNAPVALNLEAGSSRLSTPSATPRAVARPVAASKPAVAAKPVVRPTISVARADAPSVMPDARGATARASHFVSSATRGTAPSGTGAPTVDPSRLMPQLVAIVASVPTSLLRAGAQQSRATMPAGGPAARARAIEPASVDSAASSAPQVIAVATDGTVTNLTPMADVQRSATPNTLRGVPSVRFGSDVAAVGAGVTSTTLDPNAGPARLTTPAGSERIPSLTVKAPQSGMQVAARPGSGVQVDTLLEASGARLASPAAPGRSGSPSLSLPGSATGVVIAAVDPRTRQAVPLAMIQTHASMPSAARRQPQAARALPAGKMVVAPRKGGSISVVYNGKPVNFGAVGPLAKDGMTLAPFRHIMEMGGGVVLWNNLIKQVRASSDGRRIEFTIGETQAVVNNQPVQMPTAPFLKQGRAMVPMSFVREALDVVVEYDPATGRVTIAAK